MYPVLGRYKEIKEGKQRKRSVCVSRARPSEIGGRLALSTPMFVFTAAHLLRCCLPLWGHPPPISGAWSAHVTKTRSQEATLCDVGMGKKGGPLLGVSALGQIRKAVKAISNAEEPGLRFSGGAVLEGARKVPQPRLYVRTQTHLSVDMTGTERSRLPLTGRWFWSTD